MHLPILISTPHSSGFAPFDVLADMLGPDVYDRSSREARLAFLFNEGDPYTDALFYLPGARHLNALVSRFVVDLNRARDEGGRNGVIKLTDFSGRSLYPAGFTLSEEVAGQRLRRYWDSYHGVLEQELARDDIHFFIDGHSMTPRGPLIGPDEGRLRPAFNMITGGDRRGEPLAPEAHTSISGALAREIAERLEHHFAKLMADNPKVPAEVRINDPFAVGGIQQRYSDPARTVHKPGFALEFNRALFLEPAENGFDRPKPGSIEAFNQAFRAFAHDIVRLFQATVAH